MLALKLIIQAAAGIVVGLLIVRAALAAFLLVYVSNGGN